VGHERIGFLPRTKKWKAIVQQLSQYNADSEAIVKIADETLVCIRKSYEQMPYDESVSKAIKFLTLLSFSAKQDNQISYLNNNGCLVDNTLSLFSLINSAKNYITTDKGSLETNKLVKDAVLQAITTYQEDHTAQLTLIDEQITSVWKEVGNGGDFCELTRSFFSALTDRQIKYYIGRSAASEINDYTKLQLFSVGISQTAEAITHHAFETSKIMQSFAAGWFNKHAATGVPDDSHITDFLRISFGKMREEFRREAAGK